MRVYCNTVGDIVRARHPTSSLTSHYLAAISGISRAIIGEKQDGWVLQLGFVRVCDVSMLSGTWTKEYLAINADPVPMNCRYLSKACLSKSEDRILQFNKLLGLGYYSIIHFNYRYLALPYE